jgi:hypothetical protein
VQIAGVPDRHEPNDGEVYFTYVNGSGDIAVCELLVLIRDAVDLPDDIAAKIDAALRG